MSRSATYASTLCEPASSSNPRSESSRARRSNTRSLSTKAPLRQPVADALCEFLSEWLGIQILDQRACLEPHSRASVTVHEENARLPRPLYEKGRRIVEDEQI